MNTILARVDMPHLLPRGTVTPWATVLEALEITIMERRRTSDMVCSLWARYRAEGHTPGWARAQPGFRLAQDAADRAERAHATVCRFASRYKGWVRVNREAIAGGDA